jgi:hypothetical protein
LRSKSPGIGEVGITDSKEQTLVWFEPKASVACHTRLIRRFWIGDVVHFSQAGPKYRDSGIALVKRFWNRIAISILDA